MFIVLMQDGKTPLTVAKGLDNTFIEKEQVVKELLENGAVS